MGTGFSRDSHVEKAETAYKKALSLNGQDQVGIYNLASLYRETGRKNKTKELEVISKAFQRQNPFWHCSRAKAYYETGKFILTSHSICTAIRLDNDEYRFYQMAALIYRRQGEYEIAREYAAKGVKLKRKNI